MIICAIILQSTTASYNYQLGNYYDDYTCDDTNWVCIMKNINDINNWQYDVKDFTELKFTASSFSDLSASIPIISHGNLKIIDLSGNHIKSLTKFHFTVNNLLTANVSRNEIESLETSSIFDAHPSLVKIDLSFNNISFIHSEALKGLIELQELYLNNNKIKEINGFMFSSVVQLKILELSVNNIGIIEDDSFAKLENLITLNLEKNDFFEFDLNILKNGLSFDLSLGNSKSMDSSKLISLSGYIHLLGKLKLSNIIQPDFTSGSRTLEVVESKISTFTIWEFCVYITASNCNISKLIFDDENSFFKVGDFSNNVLSGDLKFENLQNLLILDLSSNQINKISFVNCTLLEGLNLSKNNLTFITNITTLPNMKILDLSFNCIDNFELNTFSSMPHLEILNVRDTCFKSIDYGTFSFQTNLKVLDISFNNLNIIDLNLLSSLANIEDFFIDGNNLTDVESFDLIGNFHNLKRMGLTNNKWSCKTLSSIINKLNQLNVKVFAENSIKHSTNVKGIGCSVSASQESSIIPQNPMLINHTIYMNKIEKINEIVKTINEMNTNKKDRESLDDAHKNGILELRHDKSVMESELNNEVNEFKTFGKEIVNKFKLLNKLNYDKLVLMNATIQKINDTNNEKYILLSESIKGLNERLKMIKLKDEENPENVDKIDKSEIKVNYEYYNDVETIRTLEIFLLMFLFVLTIVAWYYVLVYCKSSL